MNLYIMRHGTTCWNEKGITQGRTNNRLSKGGIALTESVSENHQNCNFDVIYSSPLTRTIQTANIMNKFHNAKIIKDNRLIEIDQGIFSGRQKDSLSEEEKKLKSNRSPSCGMESYESVYKRAKSFLESIKNNNYENILIITHNCNASFLEDLILNIDVDFTNENHLKRFKNAEVKSFEF